MSTSELQNADPHCAHCGAKLRANANYCWLCGASVQASAPQQSGQLNLLGKFLLGLLIAGMVIGALQIALLTICFVTIR